MGTKVIVSCAIALAVTSLQGDAARDGGACVGAECDGLPARGATVPACRLPPATAGGAFVVRFDALGYAPAEDAAWAVVLGHGEAAPTFAVYDAATGCEVGRGIAGPRVLDEATLVGRRLSGDRLALRGARAPGRYVVRLEDGSQLGPILVDADAYAEVLPKLIRFLSAQRCGPTTKAISQHAACHLLASIAAPGKHSGDAIAVDDGYRGRVSASSGRVVDVEGGWHDAGDYIKFVGTTSFTLAVDLLALRDHDAWFASPHAGAVRGALRDEMRWGLDWLARMLGGSELLHQVSGEKDHDADWRVPERDTARSIASYDARPAFRFSPGAGANLLGRSAAALALGAQVFADDAPYAAKLLVLARSVFAAIAARPSAQRSDPPDFYPERSVDDDVALGAAILAQATNEAAYRDAAIARARALPVSDGAPRALSWGDVRSLALLETALAFPPESRERADMAKRLASLAAPILSVTADPSAPAAAFGYAMGELGDGSIEQSLGAAAVCLASKKLGGTSRCAEVARDQLHWLFGRNPFGISFMVGVGGAFPRAVHHPLAIAGHVTLVGAIVGGPTSMKRLRDRRAGDESVVLPTHAGPFAPWSTAEIAYDDARENYVVNEPAIDFTAPLVFDLAELLDAP